MAAAFPSHSVAAAATEKEAVGRCTGSVDGAVAATFPSLLEVAPPAVLARLLLALVPLLRTTEEVVTGRHSGAATACLRAHFSTSVGEGKGSPHRTSRRQHRSWGPIKEEDAWPYT